MRKEGPGHRPCGFSTEGTIRRPRMRTSETLSLCGGWTPVGVGRRCRESRDAAAEAVRVGDEGVLAWVGHSPTASPGPCHFLLQTPVSSWSKLPGGVMRDKGGHICAGV